MSPCAAMARASERISGSAVTNAHSLDCKVRDMNGLATFGTVAALLASGVSAAQSPAAERAPSACPASSGATAPVIVELYTSEGCDSCPPADRWLSRVIADRGRDSGVIPLAFHVDYWDYIGWKDVFAQPEFARRQASLAASGGATGVYTPQIFVNGKDDRSWTLGALQTGAGGKAATVKFSAVMRWRDGGAEVSGKLAEAAPHVRLRYAVTENGLVSAVKAGENRGVTLRHDAVVRAHGLLAMDANGSFSINTVLPKALRRSASQLHVIAEDGRGNVLAAATIACAG